MSRVELLVTGDAGLRFKLNWEETCALRSGCNVGDQGSAVLRASAVLLVKLPIKRGDASCYLAATAATHILTRGLHLTIIDY